MPSRGGDTRTNLLISGFSCLVGLVITVIFVPDVTDLSLEENDKRWEFVVHGNAEEYVGEAVNPKFLSRFEIAFLDVGKRYRRRQQQESASLRGISGADDAAAAAAAAAISDDITTPLTSYV